MKSSTLILLLCAWAILATIIGLFQRQDLADYQAADSAAVAKRIHWDSVRNSFPAEGYAGFLKAEQDRKNAYVTYYVNRNVIHYSSSEMPTFYVAVDYGLFEPFVEKRLIVLDSSDLAYFHRKAVSQLDVERKKAIDNVNKQYDTAEIGNLWPFEDSKARWAKAHQIN